MACRQGMPIAPHNAGSMASMSPQWLTYQSAFVTSSSILSASSPAAITRCSSPCACDATTLKAADWSCAASMPGSTQIMNHWQDLRRLVFGNACTTTASMHEWRCLFCELQIHAISSGMSKMTGVAVPGVWHLLADAASALLASSWALTKIIGLHFLHCYLCRGNADTRKLCGHDFVLR